MKNDVTSGAYAAQGERTESYKIFVRKWCGRRKSCTDVGR